MKFFNSILFVLLALFQFENVSAQTFTAKDLAFNIQEFDSLEFESSPMSSSTSCNLTFPKSHYDKPSNRDDSSLISEHLNLWKTEPEEFNHYLYVELAIAYFRVKDYVTSETMLKKIMESELKCYNQRVYYHNRSTYEVSYEAAHLFGDSEHHKHTASLYLAYIYLKKEDYQTAYDFAKLASTKYSNGPSCGTTYQFYKSKMDGLKFECLLHLGQYQKLFDDYFQHYFYCENKIITDVLLKLYTREQLRDSMNAAVSSIRYTISDTGTYTRYENKSISHGVYQSISSTIFFMGQLIELTPVSYYDKTPNPKDIIWELKKTYFYKKVYANY